MNVTSTNNINWWSQLNSPTYACPCYLHTFQDGDFSWTSYLQESDGPLEASGILAQCHFFDEVSSGTTGHWKLRSDADSFSLGAGGIFEIFPGVWRAESTQLETNSVKGESLFLAPGLVLQNGIEYTITVTLKTTRYCDFNGACTAPGHKAELKLGIRDDGPLSGNHEGFPGYNVGSEATLLTQAQFATAVNAAVDDTDCCTVDAQEFATNGERVTISATYTPSADEIKYVEIYDVTPTMAENEGETTLTIYDVVVQPTSNDGPTDYPILPQTWNVPNITAAITADDGTTNGAIDISVSPGAVTDFVFCWGDTPVIEAASPDRTGLDSGWYGMKAVNITTGYHLPIEIFHVPFFKAGNLASPNNVFIEDIFVNKGNKMTSMIRHGMDSSFLDLMKIDIIKYLWDKNDTECLTDARKANFEKVLLNAFNTCTPPIVSQFPQLSGTFVNEEEVADQEIEEWAAAGALLWNGGTSGMPAIAAQQCCIGKVDYIHPAYVFHKGGIWRSTSIFSNTKTEPGSLLGQGSWEKAKKKKGVSGIQPAGYLEFQRKKSIFELERDIDPTQYGYGNEMLAHYRGMKGNYLELENREIVTPENTGNMNYII